MKKQSKFDVIVIGGGSAGFSAAEQARSLGASVCIIESGKWGGECPNDACIPTKTLLKSARVYYEAKHHLSDFGVHANSVTFNFSEMMRRKQGVVDLITGNGKRLVKTAKMLSIKTVNGKASFIDERTVKVGDQIIRGNKFVIATGAVDVVPPIQGIENVRYLGYHEALHLKQPPRSIGIVGGGPVGCEFATFFAMLGVKVYLFQLPPRILHREDEELSLLAESEFCKLGANIFTSTAVTAVAARGKKVEITYQEQGARHQKLIVDELLIAAGKRANVDGLELKNADVKLDTRGYLKVNASLQTSNKSIFGAGDVNGGYMFTHTAHEDGLMAGMNAVAKSARSMLKQNRRVVPRVTFVHPELASVGMTAQEAVDSGKKVLVGAFPVAALGRAVTDGRRIGLVKVVVDAKTRQILGGHMLCDRAGEMIHEIALAMSTGISVDELSQTTHAFPTYSEAIAAAAASV